MGGVKDPGLKTLLEMNYLAWPLHLSSKYPFFFLGGF